jgi:hypothetical protein
MVAGKQRLGGMGLYIIKELVDEAGFVEGDEDEGNQFRMVIYRMDGEKENQSELSSGELQNRGDTAQ